MEYCSRCGNKLPNNAKFCNNCGEKYVNAEGEVKLPSNKNDPKVTESQPHSEGKSNWDLFYDRNGFWKTFWEIFKGSMYASFVSPFTGLKKRKK